MKFKIKLAEVIIEIASIYGEVFSLCRDYLCEGAAQIFISTKKSDIDFERVKSASESAYEGAPVINYPDSYLETLAVYRKIAVALLDYDTYLMHGSAVCADGKAYLFTAASGVGKTTHSRLWLENVKGSYVINGDKPLIKVTDSGCRVFGTPWAGKEGMNKNAFAPLKAICFINRDKTNHISEVGFGEVFPCVIQQTYRPEDPENMKKTMELIKKTAKFTKFYRLFCNMEPQAAITAFEGMNR